MTLFKLGFTIEQIRKGITGAQGWVYYNWAVENEMSLWGEKPKRGPGYIKQEYQKLLKHGRRTNQRRP